MKAPTCSITDCTARADYEVIFYDVYLHKPGHVDVFYVPHNKYPYICQKHLSENEQGAENNLTDPGLRKYRAHIEYPNTPSMGNGFVIYRPLQQ